MVNKFREAIKSDKPYLLAETACIHEGDYEYLENLVDAIIDSECADAIKYHILLDVDSYMTPDHELYDQTQEIQFSTEQWKKLLKKGKSKDMENIVLTDDLEAINFVKENKELVDGIEIHAIALNNIEMLEEIQDLELPLIIGVGGSSTSDIEFALEFLDMEDVLLMHGFQNYPTSPEKVNLRRIKSIEERFGKPVGYADHTSWDHPHNQTITLTGLSMGSNIIEKHVALEEGEKRIDYESAVGVDEMKSIREKMDTIKKALGEQSFDISETEEDYGKIGPMKFTVVANEDLSKGEKLQREKMAFKRTKDVNSGVKQREYLDFIGKTVSCEIGKNEIINWGKIHDE